MTHEDLAPSPVGDGRELKGWHVLLWMLGFFGVVFAVNGVFLYQALASFPGEETKKSYVQGLNYNQTLEARAQQAELGWHAQIGVREGQLVVHLEDASGSALPGLVVSGEMRRRATTRQDRMLTFQYLQDGDYVSDLPRSAAGQWDVRIEVVDLGGVNPQFTARKTLYLP